MFRLKLALPLQVLPMLAPVQRARSVEPILPAPRSPPGQLA
jgi:hypothetical protein